MNKPFVILSQVFQTNVRYYFWSGVFLGIIYACLFMSITDGLSALFVREVFGTVVGFGLIGGLFGLYGGLTQGLCLSLLTRFLFTAKANSIRDRLLVAFVSVLINGGLAIILIKTDIFQNLVGTASILTRIFIPIGMMVGVLVAQQSIRKYSR